MDAFRELTIPNPEAGRNGTIAERLESLDREIARREAFPDEWEIEHRLRKTIGGKLRLIGGPFDGAEVTLVPWPLFIRFPEHVLYWILPTMKPGTAEFWDWRYCEMDDEQRERFLSSKHVVDVTTTQA